MTAYIDTYCDTDVSDERQFVGLDHENTCHLIGAGRAVFTLNTRQNAG